MKEAKATVVGFGPACVSVPPHSCLCEWGPDSDAQEQPRWHRYGLTLQKRCRGWSSASFDCMQQVCLCPVALGTQTEQSERWDSNPLVQRRTLTTYLHDYCCDGCELKHSVSLSATAATAILYCCKAGLATLVHGSVSLSFSWSGLQLAPRRFGRPIWTSPQLHHPGQTFVLSGTRALPTRLRHGSSHQYINNRGAAMTSAANAEAWHINWSARPSSALEQLTLGTA